MDEEREFLLSHRSHDYGDLIERWRAIAAKCGLAMEELGEEGGLPIYAISRGKPSRERGLYLSAGIHGDEAAAVEGLVSWAERNRDFLKNHPVVVVPCFNPWGLVNNSRTDREGRDLNRMFDGEEVDAIRRWKALLEGKEFRMGLTLHEDYDARGIYVYELGGGEEKFGDRLLGFCEGIIPREPGDDVEGRAAEAGVITPEGDIRAVLKEIAGMPEAIHLYLNHAPSSMTFETPSEYSLFKRVKAHERFLDGVVRELGG